MIEQETKHKSAGNYAWFAERDARLRSAVNSTNYTDAQKIKAERVKLALELCVFAKNIYVEYRKKFISVKVHNPAHIDKKTLALLEGDWTSEGHTKVFTSQGFTYRLFAK